MLTRNACKSWLPQTLTTLLLVSNCRDEGGASLPSLSSLIHVFPFLGILDAQRPLPNLGYRQGSTLTASGMQGTEKALLDF